MAAPSGPSGPSERSPLLADHSPSSAGGGAEPTGSSTNNAVGDDDAAAALERQESIDEARRQQFAGNAEAAKRLKYIIPVVGIGVWLSAADQTIVVSAYGRIGSELHELNKTQWLATAYLLTLTSFQPLYGKLSDIFGRKAMLYVAYSLFGLGCLGCGLAPDMDTLIAARAFAGIGGGGMTTVVSILMSDIVPLKDRGMWQGVINMIYAFGAGVGAPLGGFLAESIGWRLGFILQAPLCLLAIVGCYLALKLPHAADKKEDNWGEKLRRIDFLGAFTLVTSVGLLLVGLDRGSNVAWSDKITVATLAVSAPLALAFVFVEMRVAAEPFAPGRLIFGKDVIAAYMCNFFAFAGNYSVLFYLPLYFQGVDELSATQAGVRLLPGVVSGVTGSLAAGFIMRATGRYYWLTAAVYALLVLGSALLTLFTSNVLSFGDENSSATASTVGILVGLSFASLGNGGGVTSSLIAVISNAEPAEQAIATACSYLFRSLGCVLGLALTSTLLQQLLRTRLDERLSGIGGGGADDVAEIVRRVRESLGYIRELPPETARIVRDTYGESLSNCFVLITCLAACAFLTSLFIREKRLKG